LAVGSWQKQGKSQSREDPIFVGQVLVSPRKADSSYDMTDKSTGGGSYLSETKIKPDTLYYKFISVGGTIKLKICQSFL